MSGNEPVPVVRIVDDNPVLRESVEFMLRAEGFEVAAFESAADFLANDRPSAPGCLVLDVAMPGMSGIELQRLLLARGRTIPVIFLTAHGDIAMAVDAMHEGAYGFEQKPVKPERLLRNIRGAVKRDLESRGIAGDEGGREERYRTLTVREAEVLKEAKRGLKSREIAELLSISQRTVEHYRMSGLRKIGAKGADEVEEALLPVPVRSADS